MIAALLIIQYSSLLSMDLTQCFMQAWHLKRDICDIFSKADAVMFYSCIILPVSLIKSIYMYKNEF